MSAPDEHYRKLAVDIHTRDADWFAAVYARHASPYENSFLYGRRQLATLIEVPLASIGASAKVLDVGCGTGAFIQHLRARGHHAVGIEPSPAMREHALRSLPQDVIFDGSVLELPFESASFDAVFAIEVFRYLTANDNLAGLSEVYRVLRPGGVFFGTFVNLYALDGYYALTCLRRAAARLTGTEVDHYTRFERPGHLQRTLEAVGFHDVALHGAMLAPLRLAYKATPRITARIIAPRLERLEPWLTRRPLHGLAGHLVAIAYR